MVRTEREVYEAQANCYRLDGVRAQLCGNMKEAERCYKMAEGYLNDAGIKYTGTGAALSWNA